MVRWNGSGPPCRSGPIATADPDLDLPWREFIIRRLEAQGLQPDVAARSAAAGVKHKTSASKAVIWCKFITWLKASSSSFPVSLAQVVNFLGQLRTKAGDFISYGSYRMHKATIVKTLELTRSLSADTPADRALLDNLTKTIQKDHPDQAKYSEIFNLDDLTTRLIEEFEDKPYGRLQAASKEDRAIARQRAVVTLKLHGLFRSGDCLQMQRGSLFDDLPSSRLGSFWGPTSILDDGSSCPEWVLLRLTSTKTSGEVEHKVPFCPSEPALCPVLALFSYISLVKTLSISPHVAAESSLWLGITASTDAGLKCYKPLTSADPLANDTKLLMQRAGIDNLYKAHALRHAVASEHLSRGVSELDIMSFARWSSTSVFRKFYARTRHKELSALDLRPQVTQVLPDIAAPLSIVQNPPATPTHPARVSPPSAPPRLNIVNAKGKTLRVPGAKWWDPQDGSPCIKIHCSSCWEPDNDTMIWCRKCNRHFHSCHVMGTPSEVEQNHQEGWFCSACSK